MKLTVNTIKAISVDPERDIYAWDDELPGFGIRIKSSGVRSFMLQYRNASGVSRRLTLGKLGVLTPDDARKLAKEKLAAVAKGNDPADVRIALLELFFFRSGRLIGHRCNSPRWRGGEWRRRERGLERR